MLLVVLTCGVVGVWGVVIFILSVVVVVCLPRPMEGKG